jgi:hypothetical protein
LTGLTIETVNPFEYEAELKRLFVEHGVAHYPAFFDAAYPAAAALGSVHWVGFDSQRRIVMHVARFAHRFALGNRQVVGGLLVNLMVEKAHRTFFPVAAMMRKVVADSRAQGGLDFLYTNPNVEGGAIIKAAGLKPAGTLQRFALPLGANAWWADIGVRTYATARRLMSVRRPIALAEHSAAGFDSGRFEAPARRDVVTPFHPAEWFRIWLAGYPAPEDRWFTFGPAASPLAAVQVRGPEGSGSYRVLSVWRTPDIPLASILWPVAQVMTKASAKRLFVWTLAGSEFASDLLHMGFLARADSQPFFMTPFTPVGVELVAAVPRWEITDFDCDR